MQPRIPGQSKEKVEFAVPLILGMGLPAVVCYILLAVLVAPAVVKLGVLPIASHLCV